MLPSAFHLRRLFAVCLLFLLLPFCACAEEEASPARVYIAVDRETQFPLASLLAYQAQLQGAQVSMYSLSRPNDGAFYTSESGIFSEFKYNKSQGNEKSERLNGFLQGFFNRENVLDTASSSIDIYVLSSFSREDTVFIPKNGNGDMRRFIANARKVIEEKMAAYPNVSLHFYFPLDDTTPDKEPDSLYQDLIGVFGNRVSCKQLDYTNFSQFIPSISPSSDFLQQPLRNGTLLQDGRIAYERKGTSEWLMLSFPPETEMADVRFFADEQPDILLPLLHDTSSKAYWIYLPEGTASRSFTIDCQRSGEASAADSYTLQAWSILPAFDVALYDAQNQRFAPNTPFDPLSEDSPETAEQPAADSPETAQQPAADSPETAQQPAADSSGKMELFSENSSWTLELNCPGLKFEDLALVLELAVGDGSVKLQCDESTSEPDGDTLRWTFELPALPPETTGTLSLQYYLWNDLHCSFSWDFSVQNRAPQANGEASASHSVYADIPLGEEKHSYPYAFDLNGYFTESDAVDSLTFSIPSDRQSSYTAEIKDDAPNTLIYTPNCDASTFPVVVTACDQHGGVAVFQFNFEHYSMRKILDALRLELYLESEESPVNNVFSMPILSDKPIRFRLRDDRGTLKTMLETLKLPPLEECLKITINGTPCQIVQEETGDFIVSYTIPASTVANSMPNALDLTARFEYTPSGSADAFTYAIALDLPNILSTSFSYIYTNSAPVCKAESQSIRSYAINGLPGKYKPVSFAELFQGGQPLQLSSLFSNEETNEALTYTIRVNSGRITVHPASPNPPVILDAAGTNSCSFGAEEAAQPLELVLDAPGAYSFEIYATDSEDQSSAHAVYSATLYSSFLRLMLIVVISVTILLALIAAALTIRYLLKPSFKGARVRIRCLRGEQEASRRTANSTDTWLPLDPYHKGSVSLMALLTASGHLPPQTCSPEMLMHISLTPGKNDTVWVTCGADVKSPSVEICIGNQKQESIRRFALAHRQTLKICFRKDSEIDTLLLYAERKSA